MHKKFLSVIILLSMTINHIAGNDSINGNSGTIRLLNIMSSPEKDITSYSKKDINYAETQNLASDLNITEIAKFFGCKTLAGESFLVDVLSNPVGLRDRDTVLLARQNAVKALVENPELKNEVEKLLESARLYEQEVVALLSEQFIGKTCPELQQLELIKKQNPMMYPFISFLHVNPTANTVLTATNIVGLGGILVGMGFIGRSIYTVAKMGQSYVGLAGYAGYMALIGAFQSYAIYKDLSTAAEKRSKLHALNQLIGIAEKCEKLCAQFHIKNQFNMSALENLQGLALIKELKHSRYQSEKPWFFMTPFVHAFLYKVYQQEKHLAELFSCIAEMDAYNAIATKIIDSQSSKNKFCFVEFVDQEKPFLDTKGFWNVLVKDAVPNDFSESRHIILTGPNAGGKTTAIRALLQNIVLAQSYGVAAAESFMFTPFDIILSYLNISDDILNGLSLFASELKRAQDILQILKSLTPHKKCFFALDELFTGTVAEDGEKCAYEFVARIAEFDCVQFIYATHFNKLKELGDDNVLCANYKVNAPEKNSEGKLIFPYTLSKGSNNSNVALDLAREANLFA